ncbi:juvenile hormone acid O-methyltransferase-like [Haemaphysalis longicornis]
MLEPRFLNLWFRNLVPWCGVKPEAVFWSFTFKYLLPRLPAWCEKLVGVDNADPMLEFARQNRADPKIEYKHLDLMVDNDVARFVKEQGQFEMVFSFQTLHWVCDQYQAVRNIATLLAPGGECFLQFSHTLVLFDIYSALLESPRWKKYSEP